MSNRTTALAIHGGDMEMTLSSIVENVDENLRHSLERKYPEIIGAQTSYQWFIKENLDNASNYYQALGIANRQHLADQVILFAGAIVDLYQRDRAQRACASLSGRVSPIREEALPHYVKRDVLTYSLQLMPVQSFDAQIPHQILAAISKLYISTQTAPDRLMLGTYVQQYRSLSDPLLYAQFGRWFVKLAEWE